MAVLHTGVPPPQSPLVLQPHMLAPLTGRQFLFVTPPQFVQLTFVGPTGPFVHALSAVPAMQSIPLQQPLQLPAAHKAAALQVRVEEVHTSPAAHGAQAAPPEPQARADVPGSHVVPVQQPLQLPAEQSALLLHVFVAVTHTSPAVQVLHASPLLPQAVPFVPATQLLPLQQPSVQGSLSTAPVPHPELWQLRAVSSHVWPLPQLWQTSLPAAESPHAELPKPATQLPESEPEQQPLHARAGSQVVAPRHVLDPALHACAVPQSVRTRQPQERLALQALLVGCPAQFEQTTFTLPGATPHWLG